MLLIKELSIGNWFLNPQKQWEQVEGLLSSVQGELINPVMDYSIEQLTGYTEADCEPIPLTLDIFKRLEFEITYDFHLPYQLAYFKDGLTFNEDFNLVVTDGGGDGVTKIGKPLKYLHQLQNLIFDLTNEELPIKMPLINQ